MSFMEKKEACGKSVFYITFPYETPLKDVNQYFNDFGARLYHIENDRVKGSTENKQLREFYAKFLEISHEQVEELEDNTSIDKLTCEGEITPMEHNLHESSADFQMKYEMALSHNPIHHNLSSVVKRSEVKGGLYAHYNMKYANYIWVGLEENSRAKKDLNPFDFSTLVYCVKVYHPFLSYSGFPDRLKFLQEIHILGDQFLSELKDSIICSMDYVGLSDESNSPKIEEFEIKLKKNESYPSSFIFIGNTFYNDTRHSSMTDLSKPIIEWAKTKQLGNFTTGIMQDTKMKDLQLIIGHPYVYQHQADCEHVIIVSDIRFLSPSDSHRKSSYPLMYAKGRHTGRNCMMCGVSYARWLVVGNVRLTHNKTFLCHACFISYNYIDGQKIGNFKAYRYVDPIAVL